MFIADHHIILSMIPIYEAYHVRTGKDIVVVTHTSSSRGQEAVWLNIVYETNWECQSRLMHDPVAPRILKQPLLGQRQDLTATISLRRGPTSRNGLVEVLMKLTRMMALVKRSGLRLASSSWYLPIRSTGSMSFATIILRVMNIS